MLSPPDVLTVIRDFGIGFALALITASILLGILWRRLNKLIADHQVAVTEIEALYDSIIDPDDIRRKRTYNRGAVLKVVKQTRERTESLANAVETLTKSICVGGPAACPVYKDIEEFKRMFTEWTTGARGARLETEARIHDLTEAVDKLNSNVVLPMVEIVKATIDRERRNGQR